MPRVIIRRANKDYPDQGIKRGDTYYSWTIKLQRGGRKFRSKTYPRPSQLTLSSYKVAAHQLNEALEDLDPETVDDLRDDVQSIIDDASSLRDEQESALGNMPEGLQFGSTGELIQSRIDALQSFIDELEGLDFPDEDDHPLEDTFYSVRAISLDVD